jgi:hypothetical protein
MRSDVLKCQPEVAGQWVLIFPGSNVSETTRTRRFKTEHYNSMLRGKEIKPVILRDVMVG